MTNSLMNRKILIEGDTRIWIFIPRSLQSLQTAAKTDTEKSAFIDKTRKSGNCKRIDLCMLVKLSCASD